MDKIRLVTGMILFGSIWGFSECIIGSYIHEINLPAGAIMTGIFAVGFMIISRLFYKQRGMQLGMGVVAGLLRLFNPFGGCFICASIAIMAEGFLFELIWYRISIDFIEEGKPINAISMGIITANIIFVGGYIVTQILTPIFSSVGFYLENLIVFLPQIFSQGLLAAVLGGVVIPVALLVKNIDIMGIRNRVYYPTAAVISAICWGVVIINMLLIT